MWELCGQKGRQGPAAVLAARPSPSASLSQLGWGWPTSPGHGFPAGPAPDSDAAQPLPVTIAKSCCPRESQAKCMPRTRTEALPPRGPT